MLICLWCLAASTCCQCSLLASFVDVWQVHVSILHYSMLVSPIMRASGLCSVRLDSSLPQELVFVFTNVLSVLVSFVSSA